LTAVIVTPDLIGPVRNGGVGTFSTHFARLLRQAGHSVTILYTGPLEIQPADWLSSYQAADIDVKIIAAQDRFHTSPGYHRFIAISEAVADALPVDAEVVYFQDWQANGFIPVRQGRFSDSRPIYVTVLHSSSAWIREGTESFLSNAEHELTLDFAERYTAQYSDAVISPSQYMLNWVARHGWKLPKRQYVLGLPGKTTSQHAPAIRPNRPFRRLIFFGRLETRKGVELFIESLLRLNHQSPDLISALREIVFLGKPGEHRYESQQGIGDALNELSLPIRFLNDFDNAAAITYLTDQASESLLVIPSLQDNFPYTVIEAVSILGLHGIFSSVGGISEICGDPDRLFLPYSAVLTETLQRWLTRGSSEEALPPYDTAMANQQWLAFHRTALDWTANSAMIGSEVPKRTLDICVAYYNDGETFPQMLQALENQTCQTFNVFAVNDGSTDEPSKAIFATMRERYRSRGWQFIEKQNTGASDSRNSAARLGQAAYLCFVDSDNVPFPTMVERMLQGMTRTDSDCLTCYLSAFRSERKLQLADPLYVYLPLGNAPELGLFFNAFGDTNFIIKRSVFDALGGFTTSPPTYRYIGNEDYEFLVRLSLAGYILDVIPEFLVYYRHTTDGAHRVTNAFQNSLRVLEIYRDRLQPLGLGPVAPLSYGMHMATQNIPSAHLIHQDPGWLASHVRWFDLLTAMRYKLQKQIRQRFALFLHR
jgi:glycosyltransferase involved in cell wall biosynthesis